MTTSQDTSMSAINREAADWFAKTQMGSLHGTEADLLEEWLAANPMHARAYARAQMIWQGLDATTLPEPTSKPVTGLRRRGRRERRFLSARQVAQRKWAGGAVAAALALLLIQGADLPMRLRADAMTATGEIRTVPLPDGSVATLDTGSAIAFSPSGRQITLLRGQAAFQVAPDRQHPFSVVAGGGSTTALGTRFLVRQDKHDTRVVVTEHSVRVVTSGHASTVLEGQGLRYGAGYLGAPKVVSAPDEDAWTRGRIRVVNQPLANVVAELGRYHSGYIAVIGSDLARRSVSGTFDIHNPLGALDVIERTLGVRSTRLTDRIILIHD